MMRCALRVLLGAWLWGAVAVSVWAAPPDPSANRQWAESNAYKLGPGDIIDILVYGEEDLERKKMRLSGTGVITYPFGAVSAVGMSISDLEHAVEKGLSQGYLVNPQVSVIIEEYRPFFIYGQVEKPGGYPFQPGLTTRKAVSLGGGFKERASKEKIFVVRESDPDHVSHHIGLDEPVWPGDTVTVEESFF